MTACAVTRKNTTANAFAFELGEARRGEARRVNVNENNDWVMVAVKRATVSQPQNAGGGAQ